ncbi:glutamyl-tRNA(Gln) amidotransferase subunit A [Thermaurantimonas aggregans]|uniref:Glutamyl-tRNA(Gln) amidotransferase subunit A n=1 Tax=Thermaurantimonas aggregans TaxID=2173829 RepID=A0A401XM95_9FLAO|nr:Asp-tRNA(Asn)/Glu-tRNA(Gln) amidotransferase subunit GatA [Thermaurantimonas aggregans]MCX8148011.1 Asp-tRNA(Asn)/Glu-tRNA(Gln) amidotransferase subunit GatA [Thermaurantimonas aggregans]GCD78140.1 glutamyl-tRNA(Gln) amidotransferase subunit A [Thermaurantimonas aggregans]
MMEYTNLHEWQSALKKGEFSCLEAVNHYIEHIEKDTHNAFVEIFYGEARERATVIDQKLRYGTAGKLAGMIIGIKDNLCLKDHHVSAGSKILDGFESLYTATVVERLVKEDAIIIGRLNMDEFAMGSSNTTSYYGPVKNPHNPAMVPGGSSGGSAAAVAAGLCHAALGSDTGGSVRQPAAFCGIYGLKPTYGRLSRYGLIAFASSFDQVGPMTTNLEDMALLMEVMAGKDPMDSTSSSRPVEAFSKALQSEQKFTIGYLAETLNHPGLDPVIRQKTLDTLELLRSQGHSVVEVHMPYLDYLTPIYYIIATAEASSNLARYDGVHFGYRSPNAKTMDEVYTLTRTEGFGTEVKRRIMLGTFVLSSGFYDAYYGRAQRARRLITDTTNELFQLCDFLLTPTTPGTAFPIEKKFDDPTKLYLEDVFTVLANITGIPAISIPAGRHSSGLPIGIQLMAPKYNDFQLFELAAQLRSINT